MHDDASTPDPRPLAGAALVLLGDAVPQETVRQWWQAARHVSRQTVASGQPSPAQQDGQVCMTAFLGEVHRLLGEDDVVRDAAISAAASQADLMAFLATKEPIMRAAMPDYLPILQGFLGH
ncbi:hypothetical protein AB0331_15500 [Dietzia maris]|jgi:hypothetical protein|uniref:hypothetical protein n=1 Tax=Dietzia maris TaxID=37915 RepID=UPI003450A92C